MNDNKNATHFLRNPSIPAFKHIGLVGILLCMGLNNTTMAQSYVGKIIIDGEVYGEGDSKVIKGNGVPGKETRDIDAFETLSVSGSIDVYFKQDSKTHLEISADQNLLPILKTQVSGDKLKIYATDSYSPKLPITVQLSGPSLSEVIMDGAGNLELKGIQQSALKLQLNGSGDVKAVGSAKEFAVSINGTSNVKAKDLVSKQANVQIIGSGDVKLTVTDQIKATIVGSGDVHYYGNPKRVEPQIIGSGDIESGE